MTQKWPVLWRSKTTYVDIDTGEEITKQQVKLNYVKIKIEKHATFTNYNRTKGTIYYTILARHRKLQELPFTD